MILLIEECKTSTNKVERTISTEVCSSLEINPLTGYLPFKGIREEVVYEKMFYIREIKDDEVIVDIYKDDKVLHTSITLKKDQSQTFKPRGPKGLPIFYFYRLTLK